MAYLDNVKLADYTRKEDWLNSISHIVGGGLSVVALIMCCVKSIILKRWDYFWLSVVYGLTMIGMYTCSSVYHALKPNNGKKVMRMIDHSMIYPMISGTITPYALLIIKPVKPVLGWIIFGIAWAVCAVIIPLTLTVFEKTKAIGMVLYLALGWMIIICVKTLLQVFSLTGTILLIAGGIAYTVGAIVYGIGSKKRYFHSVFHFFVIAGSVLHFLSIFIYVLV